MYVASYYALILSYYNYIIGIIELYIPYTKNSWRFQFP